MVAPPPPNEPTPPSDSRVQRLKRRTMEAKAQGMDRLEVERSKRPSVRLAFDFYQRDRAFAGSLLAGGIAVKLFLWVLPFSLTFIVFLGALAEGLDTPPAELAHEVGLTAVMVQIVDDAVDSSSRARIYLGILGLVLLIWTGMGVARALRLVSRLSWKMESAPLSIRCGPRSGSSASSLRSSPCIWLRSGSARGR